MITVIKESIFYVDVAINGILLFGILWSIALPEKRIWPPAQDRLWQYRLTWGLFYLIFISNALLVLLDWNTWILPDEVRFLLGAPLIVAGALLVSWAVITLGIKNTSGLRAGFIFSGPYRYTRNPQYLGDTLLFTGISLVSNSLYVLLVHLLMILVFVFTPFTEEAWLEKQYGEEYRRYKRNTPRFL